MKQYLLSVHMVDGSRCPPRRRCSRRTRQVDAFNAELMAVGRLGVRRRPPPADHRHRRAGQGRRGADHRRPLRRDQGAARRVLGRRGRRPRRGPGSGGQGSAACGPVEVRPFQESRGLRRVREPRLSTGTSSRSFRQEYGRAVATLVRLFGDIDVAEEAVQEAFLVASAALAGRRVCRPTRAGGSSPPPATGPSTGCGGRRPATTAMPRPRSCTSATSRRRWAR